MHGLRERALERSERSLSFLTLFCNICHWNPPPAHHLGTGSVQRVRVVCSVPAHRQLCECCSVCRGQACACTRRVLDAQHRHVDQHHLSLMTTAHAKHTRYESLE